MSSPTRPASQEEQTVSSPDELRHVAGSYKNEHDEFIDDYPVSAAVSLAYSHRLANLADALDALREAVKGCGSRTTHGDECGHVWADGQVELCATHETVLWRAIATLTGVISHE